MPAHMIMTIAKRVNSVLPVFLAYEEFSMLMIGCICIMGCSFADLLAFYWLI
jgi:hypothetical protein